MIYKKISTILAAVLATGIIFNGSVLAANEPAALTDVAGSESFEELNAVIEPKQNDTKKNKAEKKVRRKAKSASAKAEEVDSCAFNYPDSEDLKAEVVAVRRQLKIQTGEVFRVKVFLKNTSNMPWFSNKSECHGLKMSLGTDKERDHKSAFYQKELAGWESPSRVGMDQLRVDPYQIASFTFMAKAGEEADVYKEYFTPVLKDVKWLDEAQTFVDVMIGETGEDAGGLRQKVAFSVNSGSVTDLDLRAERKIKVDLSDQTLSVYLGDNVVRQFKVSTGKPSTPTPKGKYEVMLKQDIRVGFKPPHYIMPKFMMFRSEGYGFHALPSLARNGGDAFWTEARDHIGIPVSHGCVRLLPEDANWVFDFSDIGTTVEIEA